MVYPLVRDLYFRDFYFPVMLSQSFIFFRNWDVHLWYQRFILLVSTRFYFISRSTRLTSIPQSLIPNSTIPIILEISRCIYFLQNSHLIQDPNEPCTKVTPNSASLPKQSYDPSCYKACCDMFPKYSLSEKKNTFLIIAKLTSEVTLISLTISGLYTTVLG